MSPALFVGEGVSMGLAMSVCTCSKKCEGATSTRGTVQEVRVGQKATWADKNGRRKSEIKDVTEGVYVPLPSTRDDEGDPNQSDANQSDL